jgi:phage tail-like protein
MAETARRTDPFLGFRFEVTVDGIAVGAFSECGGLQHEVEFVDYAEGGLNTHVHKFPARGKQAPIRLKRGIADRVLWDWYASLLAGSTQRRNGAIRILDAAGSGVEAEWRFSRALPTKWTGPELNATQNQVAVESLELVHEGLERGR